MTDSNLSTTNPTSENEVRSWLQRGLAAAHANDESEARRCFGAARKLDPNNTVALLWLAWLAPTRRESLSLFCRVLELDPTNKRAQAGIEWVHNQPRYGETYPLHNTIPIQVSRPSPPAVISVQEDIEKTARRIPSVRNLIKSTGLGLVLSRTSHVLVTLAVVILLTLFGLIVAERGQQRIPAEPLSAAGEAVSRAVTYVIDHPDTYYWHRENIPAFELVATAGLRSGGLLLLSLVIATLIGVPLGITAALARRERGSPLVLLISILGISTPSFLLAMLLGVLNILVHQRLGTPALPPNGLGWDAHLIMPALVLAARPLAQIVQITYVSMTDILRQDYIRVAQAKGLGQRMVLNRHALCNALVPIFTTLSTSLRLSLASLPVVEFFFLWPGVGFILLQAIEMGNAPLVTDLIVTLGLLFLLVNLALDFIYPLLDPRMRDPGQTITRQTGESWQDRALDMLDVMTTWWTRLRRHLPGAGKKDEEDELPTPAIRQAGTKHIQPVEDDELSTDRPTRHLLGSLRNPLLVIGTLMVLTLFGLALFGERLTDSSAYQTHGVMTIDGEINAPPFPPSTPFPWGADPLGRDMKALILAGAKQTLTLALFATAARMLVGTVLGMLAGWWRGGRLDRFLGSTIGVWAAFPITLFAIIVIRALGIEKGMSIFVIALCVVGWAEIAQFVRGQVIGVKPQLHIEAARAIGARTGQILTRHVLPLLLPSLLVLAVLEMGGVLMLLSELGFLNIFLGGGFKVQIAEVGRMVPVIAFYSDIPEWGALLANIRGWWRAYPWLAWYPGLFFFLAILAFNLWGEGLRRWLDQTRFNVSRLFSRYSLAGVVVLALGLTWVLRSTAPLGTYISQARQFDSQRALEDIQTLASPQFEGRETGTPGAKLAAEYIAAQMKDIGLQPAGQSDTYFQTFPCPWRHLTEPPHLEILDEQGNVSEALTYRQDFAEYIGPMRSYGTGQGALVGLVIGPDTGTTETAYRMAGLDLEDNIVLIFEEEAERINYSMMGGVLVVSDDPLALEKKQIFPKDSPWTYSRGRAPIMRISQELAERLLKSTGSSLADLKKIAQGLEPGEVGLTSEGMSLSMEIVVTVTDDSSSEECYNVIGFIPGTGAQMEASPWQGLDSQVIMVHAYYDGLGVGPDGTLYPGANDNASGVATMLEIARVLNQGEYQPKKTVVFVAWTGGERGETLSVRDVMNAKLGFGLLTVEAVIELSGVGAGTGHDIALGEASSYRLVQLYQKAARRLGASTTTRGRGPHFGVYVRPDSRNESALPIYVSYDGSDQTAHTPADTIQSIDSDKLEEVGQATLLTLTVLSREVEY